MSIYSYKGITPTIITVGVILMLIGAKFPNAVWLGIDWSNFFSNLGLYIAVVVAIQWYYDRRTKSELFAEVTQAALANANVARSGINDYVENTRNINYDSMLTNSEEIFVGFQYNPRFIDDHITELSKRAKEGKKTSVLLAKPNGSAANYLSVVVKESDHIQPSINKVVRKINQINGYADTKNHIKIKYHDAILRYSFVCASEGVWVKMYRNSNGPASPPGLYVKNSSPLFEFYKRDILQLWKESDDVTP